MKKYVIRTGIFAVSVLAITSCGKTGVPGIEGAVSDADGQTIYLESAVMNNWTVVDSASLDAAGKFSLSPAEAPTVPSVYRLRLGNEYVYVPVDSVETVSVTANGKNFGRDYKLSGNIYADGFVAVDSLVNEATARLGGGAYSDATMKEALARIINTDTTCLVSYYAIGKTIGGNPIFSVLDKKDLRVLANAANNYSRFRPNDPRAEELKNRWITGRRVSGATPTESVEMQADVAGRPKVELKRYDATGKMHDFDKTVTRGGVTLLSLTRYDTEYSQPLTVALTKAYDAYHSQGLEIYQVSYEPDEVAWKRSAQNMPWIAVWNSPTDGLDALVAYNADPINGVPSTFVFNRDGELVARVNDPAQLQAVLAKLF